MKLEALPIQVLIIQTDAAQVFVLKNVLDKSSVSISQIIDTPDLRSAIQYLQLQTPDIIFLDLSLSDSKGLNTFLHLKSHSRQCPVVILTGEKTDLQAIEAVNSGAQDFLSSDELEPKVLSKVIRYNIRHKRISQSLQEVNERYDLVSKATNDMLWDWDLLKNKVYRSREGWCRLFGTPDTGDNELSDSWIERVHPDDREKTDGQIDKILQHKEMENFELECRVIRDDGSYAHVIDRGYVIRNEDGEAIRLIGVTQNITEQKLAEERLKTSEKRFRSIIERSNEGLILLNADGAPLDISPAARKILGFSGLMDELVIDISEVHPHDVTRVQDAFAEIFGTPNIVKVIEYRYKKLSGSYIWLEATCHNLLHEPSINAIAIHFRDISSRKMFEEILKNSEEKYRHLFNVNPSSIIISDPNDFTIREVNDAAIKEFGYTRKAILKMRTIDLVAPKDQERLKKLSDKMQREAFQTSNIWEVKTKDGGWKYVDAISQGIDYYGKKATLTIANNITEKIELEQNLAEQRIKSQQDITTAVITAQEQERGKLGKELHDNINQILVTTKLYIEYAMANEDVKNALLTTAKGFLTSAVSEIRNLSKSLLPPSLGEVGLIMALEELVESLHAVNKFTIHSRWENLDETKLSEDLKLTVFRILQEQLSNIIKHAEAKNVWIKIKIKNERLSIEVKDDGVGFNGDEKHSGVGLKNIKSRAELHNGRMKLKSKRLDGCTLSVQFNL
ncbi:PAS domain S-box protein [Ferruginibacter sp. HRS2-29]|uniref:PAS domain S-box protein n=1 Tax=Ferruginibacter sp. HRS2-29 TaxID=2487334 RepID=UPI0020CDE769|nr:PAS domain S-box protein [Ferruginibacter sp. HRS2-29]MCP9750394.1 PAS domain S-box protein [Ferruginibacter sp. HRS2-29]